MWNSENEYSNPILLPSPEPPEWLDAIEPPLCVLLKEIYRALDAGMYAIALMGVRSVLDLWVSEQTSFTNNFPRKIQELVRLGTLSTKQGETLGHVFDAGSAAAHRGYAPSLADALSAIDAVENILHQRLVDTRVDVLKGNTPQRARD